jgi:hypothetical protein
MDFFDQRLPQRLSRYPALAEHEDGPPPYDEYAPYDEIGTEFGNGNSYAGSHGRGLPAAAVTGFLGAAVAIGVANFTAAFFRPQASPISAVGGAFIDHTPSALKHFAVEKFGANDKDMLLLGMYVTIALIAMAIGIFAWRHVSVGVAGIGLFGLFAAYVAITRPGSRITDAIPSVVGGLAAIAVIVWLIRAGTRPGADETAAHESGDYESAGYESPTYGLLTNPTPAYRTGWTA